MKGENKAIELLNRILFNLHAYATDEGQGRAGNSGFAKNFIILNHKMKKLKIIRPKFWKCLWDDGEDVEIERLYR